jgi:hypothetical protein
MAAWVQWHEAGDSGCLASDGGKGRGRDHGLIGPSGPEAKWAGRWQRVLLGMLSHQGGNFFRGRRRVLS